MKKFLCLILISFVYQIGFSHSKKILIIASNVKEVNGNVNGTYLMEIAFPFNYLTQQGYEIDIVSPKGGKIALYHKGDTAQNLKEIAKNTLFILKTSNSITPNKVNPKNYCAVLYPGGYGQFWDVYKNNIIAEKVSKIYESGGVIGSLGHGTSSLIDIRLNSNEYLVKGITMTCFPTWCEKEYMTDSDYGKALPFDMQKELELRGAHLQVCTKEDPNNNQILVDKKNRVVTASFADAGEFVAKEMDVLLKSLQ